MESASSVCQVSSFDTHVGSQERSSRYFVSDYSYTVLQELSLDLPTSLVALAVSSVYGELVRNVNSSHGWQITPECLNEVFSAKSTQCSYEETYDTSSGS